MDQVKTGKFIAQCRKEKNMTQAQLAERMGVSDRAVSKWETGRSLPDSGIMLELTETLGINVNELLTGERISMENYQKTAENNLIKMREQEEAANRILLKLEVVIGVLATVSFLAFALLASLPAFEHTALRVVLLVLGFAIFIFGVYYALWIERTAGYYECKNCGHRYVPSMWDVLWAVHIGRTRKLRCPSCGVRCWHKKVLAQGKEEER